ncbi:VOC family protein [Duganella violaceipulchra]|uniref:4-hydroxyphenylpyruvate dioxygenase-like putative hemolysin n=1 Tax=Duganella violaceipulchra TaxID=2849652 RepID=A0AA41HBM1_9BURK|nr:VOC family protein [Duganella violaceicalia]MBV6325518.1 VOC family protein [Duganella violaceicalia]MCP2012693.1 4-hydroxyphenylpyruvate dioxygenase-like putative hemolysin [Duganella violaceicalia]
MEHTPEHRPAARPTFQKIDHIAIAVRDLDAGVDFFTQVLGFTLLQRRRVQGARTGMVSAEMEHNGMKFVLCQGTEPESQVSRLIDNFGPGVAHIALAVNDAESTASALRGHGLAFDTSVIRGDGLRQVFSSRDANTGLSFEFIERGGEEGFLEDNVNELFAQLERSGAY